MTEAGVFCATDLHFRYPAAEHAAIRGVCFVAHEARLHAVVGPNGSGKSTLLRLLLGALEPDSGRVQYAGRPVASWPRAELARRVGAVPQAEPMPFPITVRELVAMGRYPHLGPWRRERAADRRAIAQALERCDIAELADRMISTLSGGELQRVRIARALAQQPETLLLDEPTASLDVRHEMAIFELLRALTRHHGTTVVLVTHNLNLAARFADRVLLLDRGAAAAAGSPRDVLTAPLVERVYGWPVRVLPLGIPGPDADAPQIVPLSTH